MSIDLITLSFALSVLAVILSIFAFQRSHQKLEQQTSEEKHFESTPLQLQAYERLVLLTERIALAELINRLYQPGYSAMEMKQLLLDNIRQEFSYNTSQQLYVSQLAWDAVRNLKEQEIMLINQVYSLITPTDPATAFTKKILETEMAQTEGSLRDLVTQVLNREAKKIM
ncbi:MAG: hypothetical protein FJY19_01065 [Bacteroidetes bacterium]|nr:hypothetical protein [Bacteroidota bacterium]